MIAFIKKHCSNHYIWIAIVTIVSMAVTGYHVGGFDQSIHIPFLKKTLDPSLYPGDSFFELRHEHFSYFWFLFYPFYRGGIFYQALFVAQLLSTFATFWMIWRISIRVTGNKGVAYLATLFLMLPHVAFSGFPVVEFQTLNRTVVLPFVLYALELVIQKKMFRAFFIMGIMYNFHVVTVNFLLIPAGLLLLKDGGLRNISKVPQALLLFILGALPVLSWKLGSSGVPFEVHKEWFWTIDQGVLNNVFSLVSATDYVLAANLGGVAIIFLMMYLFPKRDRSLERDRLWFVGWSSLVVVLASYVFYELYPFTLLVQFQLTRAMVLTQVVFYVVLAEHIYKRIRSKSSGEQILETSIPMLGITPIIVFFQEFVATKISLPRLRILSLSVIMMSMLIVMAMLYGRVWEPGIFITPQKTPWIDIQNWAQANTRKDDIFLTPPEIWWHTTPSWHVYSERSNVASLSDLLEIAFFPEYYETWRNRFDTVAPGAREQFTGNMLANQEIVKDAYYSLSEEEIRTIGNDYHARYFIAENSQLYSFPVAYTNEEYTAYFLNLE